MFMYLNSRFYFTGLLFKCQFCFKSKRRGKIEDFKDKIIQDIKDNKDTRDAFYRYCLGDKEMKYLQAELFEKDNKMKEPEKQNLNDRDSSYKSNSYFLNNSSQIYSSERKGR